MKNGNKEKIIIAVVAVFVLLSVWFMFGRNIGGNSNTNSNNQIRKNDSTQMPTANNTTSEITKSITVKQNFVNTADTISKVGVVFIKNYSIDNVNIVIELREGNNVLAKSVIDTNAVEAQHRTYVEPSSALTGMKNKNLTLVIYSEKKIDTGLAIMIDDSADSTYSFGSKTCPGTLCFSVTE